MNLWELPTDILDLVLIHLSIEDYVHLLQTCNRLRRVLDNNHLYLILWKASFASTLEAYEFPYDEDLQTETSIHKLYSSIKELEAILIRIQKYLEGLGDDVKPETSTKIDNLLNFVFSELAIDESLFVPIVYLADKYRKEFHRATENTTGSYNISHMCWTRQLLHLQNVNMAVKFLQNSQPEHGTDFEKFLFEMSRFDFGFPELSKVRVAQIKKLKQRARSMIPIPNGKLMFANEHHFLRFVGSLANRLSGLIERRPHRNSTDQSTGLNVLREYHGQNAEPTILRVAIISKILQEEVFGKHSFQIGSEIHTFTPKLSQHLIMFGKYRLRIRTNTTGFVAENGPLANPAEERILTMGLDYGKALALCTTFKTPFNNLDEYMDNIMYSEVAEINVDKDYWLNSLKFMETLLSDNTVDLNGLVENDLVFFVGMARRRQPLNFQWTRYIMDKLTLGHETHQFSRFEEQGLIAFDDRGDKYGVIADICTDTEHPTFLAYTHNGKLLTFDASGIELLHHISPKALQGFLTSQGFNFMGMFYLTEMRIDNGEYRLLQADGQKEV
ncbi:CIC11C00000005703 [Sungouiella intermedia]|uniref:CIC11C00000005703 n=1 Tax=Sungouiella intermedia TaxID=45354 RepID=A0A1L0C5U8_9ASCO|nr:CIC11C00000005703 [[Candida] intermedia]